MRLPVTKRVREAESKLNLPPGFRFHPTDEELIVHYLCRKSQSTTSEIIADVDIYKHEPWELPEMALFGTKEWYFFTPRDRKYPNGSKSNRVTGNGYWKATGADKPIMSKSDTNETIGIKKAMVFYAGKGIKGIKTNWIMHEYRLVMTTNPSPSKHTNATTSKLDDWILCRVYNKKNNPKEIIIAPKNNNIHPASPLQKENSSCDNSSDSLQYSNGEFDGNFEGDAIFPGNLPLKSLSKLENRSKQSNVRSTKSFMQKDDLDDGNDWLNGLSLEDLHHYLEAMPPAHDLY